MAEELNENPVGGKLGAAASIHDRMLAFLKLAGYERWLGTEPDPRDLLIPFPSGPMTIWPISRRVNSRSIVRGLQAFSYERIFARRALKRRAYPV